MIDMTNKRQLGEATYQYTHKQDSNTIRENPFTSVENAFQAGAHWMRNIVWHNAEEEPRLHEELLLITRTAIKCLTGRYVGNGYYHLHGFGGEYTEIDKWAYIQDILSLEK